MALTAELRREIKQRVYPLLATKGFVVDQRNAPQSVAFRRMTAGAVHLLGIQWEKSGRPRFVVNFGRCSPAGIVVRGEKLPATEVFPSFAPVNGRLQPRRGAGTASWFRQDRSLLARLLGRRRRPAPEVVSGLIVLLPELDAFWLRGEVGPHMWLFPAFPDIADLPASDAATP